MILRQWSRLAGALILGFGVFATVTPVRAEYLYNGYLIPSINTDYSAWDVFYTPYGSPNYPDFAAPYGAYGSAPVGFTPPVNSSPSSPSAYWDVRNPTITQVGTSTAFIIGPGISGEGNIYSFAAPTSFVVQGATPYALGTVFYQMQTEGSTVDFSSILLQYTNSNGQLVSLAPTQYLKEYRAESVAGQGFSVGNRLALEWNLTGLNITSYTIVYNASSSSMSLQQATLDTAATFSSTVPQARTWSAVGAGLWSLGSNWAEGTSSNENGNVFFNQAGAANITLDANHTVGEITFKTASNTTVNSTGGAVLMGNTGISTVAGATGTYTINANYILGAYNVFDDEAGTVKVNGTVSGNYGIFKSGEGRLELNGNNTFTGSVGLEGGTLRLSGTNTYAGGTSVVWGTLIVAGDATVGGPSALGNDTSTIALGADSSLFANVGIPEPAAIVIDGDHTISRDIALAVGTAQKNLGAENSTLGATFSGNINLSNSSNVHLNAANATDKVTFTNGLSGGLASTSGSPSAITIDGLGTVVLGGTNKTYSYLNDTFIASGTLRVAQGASLTSTGTITVAAGSKFMVDGFVGTGTFNLHGTLGGIGAVNRAFTVDATSTLAPGNGMGTLTTVSETWVPGGTFQFNLSNATGAQGADWNFLQINGSLTILATAASAFHINLDSLGLDQLAGIAQNFNAASNYTWKIADASSGISGFNASDFIIDSSGFSNPLNGTFSISQSGHDLFLNYVASAVPEPSPYLMVLCGLGLLMWKYRRRAA